MLVEEANDLISAHTNDIHAIFTFASSGFGRILGVDPKVRWMDSLAEACDRAAWRASKEEGERGGEKDPERRDWMAIVVRRVEHGWKECVSPQT